MYETDPLLQISWEKKPYQPEEFVPLTGPLAGCSWIVDCIECPISEPASDLTAQLYWSGKAHETTIKYEVACHISTGRIMHVVGGVSGAINDRELLKKGGLLKKAPKEEQIEAILQKHGIIDC